jgi:hypothetical protein
MATVVSLLQAPHTAAESSPTDSPVPTGRLVSNHAQTRSSVMSYRLRSRRGSQLSEVTAVWCPFCHRFCHRY